MGDLNQEYHGLSNCASLHRATQDQTLTEPVRTRWTPKPEQILILESIFNSGMVNPPKDETVRIRKLLERFGSVGDANVFYWFQNRRSRSRRRQRQLMQATLVAAAAATAASDHPGAAVGVDALYQPTSISTTSSSSDSMSSACIFSNSTTNFSHINNTSSGGGAGLIFPCSSFSNPSPKFMVVDDGGDDLFSISRRLGLMDGSQIAPPPSMCSSKDHVLHFQPTGTVTVFIDGIPWEVPMGSVDLRAVFGQNAAMLMHSSGEILPVNEHGILMRSLQMGESYFLVSYFSRMNSLSIASPH